MRMGAAVFIANYILSMNGAFGDEKTPIVCDYRGTYNLEDGSYGGTSGATSFVIIGDKMVWGEYGPMLGTISEYQIDVSATQQIENQGAPIVFRRRLKIDRLSGQFTLYFGVEGKPGGLIHEGVCRPGQQLF
jgi:hypothetical protein